MIRPIQGWDKLGLSKFFVRIDYLNEYLQQEWTERWGDGDVQWCMYSQWEGTCSWSDWETDSSDKYDVRWSGMEAFEFEDGELGLLLDLDAGTLTAYKNGRRLGIMKDVSTCHGCQIDIFYSIQLPVTYFLVDLRC